MANPFEMQESTLDSTIDESVWESIKRDIIQVGRRLKLVILPGLSTERIQAELRDWELWGPLFICMSLAIILSVVANDDASLVFSVIFVVVWVGSAVVTINAQLLGGKISFFQTLCLLGYCIFPLLISTALCFLWNKVIGGTVAEILQFVSVVIALSWSIWASASFMADARFPDGRKLLALYPVLLFYLSVAWMILIGFQQHNRVADGSQTDGPAGDATDAGDNDEVILEEGDESRRLLFNFAWV